MVNGGGLDWRMMNKMKVVVAVVVDGSSLPSQFTKLFEPYLLKSEHINLCSVVDALIVSSRSTVFLMLLISQPRLRPSGKRMIVLPISCDPKHVSGFDTIGS